MGKIGLMVFSMGVFLGNQPRHAPSYGGEDTSFLKFWDLPHDGALVAVWESAGFAIGRLQVRISA